jgi:hypothetical protein
VRIDENQGMRRRGVRISLRHLMIAIAVLAVLTTAAIRFVYAGWFIYRSLHWEREELRLMEEALASARTDSPFFQQYDKEVAQYHAAISAYHSRCKWLYVRAMFSFWSRFPERPPMPEIVRPKIPYVPPPTPIPRTDPGRKP